MVYKNGQPIAKRAVRSVHDLLKPIVASRRKLRHVFYFIEIAQPPPGANFCFSLDLFVTLIVRIR